MSSDGCETNAAGRATLAREILSRESPTILMEAHNGLTARLVEEAGFEAIWASGLAISASLGLRDANEISWSQLVDVVETICDATRLPVLVDGDEGFGNFNNARRLVQKLDAVGAGGVCFEDKVFPKSNSFVEGVEQQLSPIPVFAGKIAAAVDARSSRGFAVVARTEAMIVGKGVDEALARAAAYAAAGADSVLVHSKRSDGADILEFLERWDSRVPVTLVPTKYPSLSIRALSEAGASNFIFANQGLRTIISALKANLAKLRASSDLMSIESEIAPISEVFRLQNLDELLAAEKKYEHFELRGRRQHERSEAQK
jgi:phosphoenolpyruvate phosphomutase